MELNLVAYPKINLCLYVGKKRPDGYHPLISVFQLVEDEKINDRIKLDIEESSRTEIRVGGLEGKADGKDNTVYKAVSSYLENADMNASVSVEIQKRIPSLAGLGGGSSDAGAVLCGLNGIYKKFSKNELVSLALEIGSDVPFFVSECKTAVVEGRGELITPVESRNDLVFKLVQTDFKKAGTGFAYGQLDKRIKVSALPSKQSLTEMYYKPVAEWDFYNDFEILYNIPEGLYLSGSGTYCFSVSERKV